MGCLSCTGDPQMGHGMQSRACKSLHLPIPAHLPTQHRTCLPASPHKTVAASTPLLSGASGAVSTPWPLSPVLTLPVTLDNASGAGAGLCRAQTCTCWPDPSLPPAVSSRAAVACLDTGVLCGVRLATSLPTCLGDKGWNPGHPALSSIMLQTNPNWVLGC